ncbi:asparaginase [Pseudoclavibacter endophyticus]|uniref:Asparaginase n=1 Tax=Pseudoclavibacter endophyticus TaxID=1778590 RepID=A0A6H9WG15_9MICO|nr:asparaginase [Pseudoclavibacter endophyticus]KAB1649899.1 asparaginase [Pseudoclavibacter endophyticus]GGA58862.1 asparaginase [Pseudoclavibacter endophyticus]
MSETFAANSAAELAVVERSGFIESRHLGSAAVVSAEGALLAAVGDIESPVFPRSTLKPFQALAALTAGAELSGEHLAIAQASHGATPAHVALVREILGRAGLDDRALTCPPDWPLDRAARDALVRAGGAAAPVYMNCSGKHAAFLAACVAQEWPLESVLDPEHPMQAHVRDTVERLTSARPTAVGVDGCGAPVLALPLLALARGVGRLRASNASSPFPLFRNAAAVMTAALEHGWAIDGPSRPNAVVIDELNTYAKSGAEGMLAMSAPNGTTVAVKVLDGSSRASTLVGLQLLVAAGALDVSEVQRAVPRLGLEVHGGGTAVGAIRVGADVPTRISVDAA